MKQNFVFFVVLITALQAQPATAGTGKLCKTLSEFVSSVKPDEKRTLEFHTAWGSNFKDSPEPAYFAKRCIHNDYAPAQVVCRYLMESGAVEFSGNNFMGALACLSPGTTFGPHVTLNKAEVSFSYGTENRGSLIDITFDWDEDIGGMILKITADGY